MIFLKLTIWCVKKSSLRQKKLKVPLKKFLKKNRADKSFEIEFRNFCQLGFKFENFLRVLLVSFDEGNCERKSLKCHHFHR